VQIAHVSRDVHCSNLSFPLTILVETADDSSHDKASMLDVLAKRNKVAVRLHLLGMARQIENSLPLLLSENRPTREPVEECLKIKSIELSHDAFSILQAGAR
jgi:hypothetical protein